MIFFVVVAVGLIILFCLSNVKRRQTANKATALAFDLSPARVSHMQRMGTSEPETSRLDQEFRRWFVVAAASPVLIGMGSKAVDEYWHTLLGVQDGLLYRLFSQAVADRHIAHVEGVGSDDLNARAWVGYEAVWGGPPPADLYPMPPEDALARHRATASDGGSWGVVNETVSLAFDGVGDGGGGGDGGGCGGGCGGGGK